MSKVELQKTASERSGVTYEESLIAAALDPSIYERIGDEGFMELSRQFYNRVFTDQDDAPWFVLIFSSSTRAEAMDNQYRFLVQTFGGPPLYRARKGKYTRLVGRHANYAITERAAQRWIHHMVQTLKELPMDAEVKEALEKYFRYTAHYIVASLAYMRSDQLSGGTEIDRGRIW